MATLNELDQRLLVLIERVITEAELSPSSDIKTKDLVEADKILTGLTKRMAGVKVLSKEEQSETQALESMFDEA